MRTSTTKLHKTLSMIILAIGAVLMAAKIYADSEPGLIPIVLVLIGLVGYGAACVRKPDPRP
ncbi:hypothetical protein CR105_16340 [Massilia eurypsychrophila]|jgi:hypothetical protein|uniref:Uncharacterized protein n=1 Tax=Massilia eurypsychrophila TaxID=1485217 RepID=A0A2G8TCY2_9BURK|nr:hypothetical protein [Massilia eurypsychrophila]PIL43916.1 hypothetical protein CR105_16340 [Massilia eurypsychrophila]